MSEIPDDTTIYRVGRSASWIDPDNNGEFLPVAFELRSDENGLSINYNCDIQYAKTYSGLKKVHGIAQSRAGDVRSLNLNERNIDVIPDPPPPEHGLIINVPPIGHEDVTHVAHELAACFRRVG